MTTQVTRRNARFQQWRSLLHNRSKRQRAGEFLVQGVRPITMAVRHGWPVAALLHRGDGRLSQWATGLLAEATAGSGAEIVAVSGPLLGELGEKPDSPPELLAVVRMPADDLDRVPLPATGPVLVLDRPASPGNLGAAVRSADAFGAAGVVVTGHAVDLYDPKVVRASTGSLFAVPSVRAAGPAAVLDWVAAARRAGADVRILGTDEHGASDIAAVDLTGPLVLVVGNEASGLSAAWREACDQTVRIPIGGSASSLNAAAAASVILYEAARQRAAGR